MITSSYLKRTTHFQKIDKENEDFLEEKRLSELKNRFSNLGTTVQKLKQGRLEVLDERISQLQDDLSIFGADKCLLEMKLETTDLKSRFEESNLDFDELDSRLQRTVAGFVEEFREELDELRADNRGLLSEFSKQSSDRLFALRLSLQKNQKAFKDHLNEFSSKVGEELDSMRDKVEREGDDRDASAQGIESTIMAELDRIEEDTLVEKRVREETSLKIKSLIEDLNNEIYRKVEVEKKERELSSNSLLNLLDEACSRIERNFASL